jgi:hypothetical protein
MPAEVQLRCREAFSVRLVEMARLVAALDAAGLARLELRAASMVTVD